MKKRSAALLLSFLLCLCFLSSLSFAEEEELLADIVSDAAPFAEDTLCRIESAGELFSLAERVNAGDPIAAQGSYLLSGDIVIDGAWQPIGTADFPFRGSFCGGGKRIFFRAEGGEAVFGLFGVTEGARLTQIALDTAELSASEGCEAFGGIVGRMRGGCLSESYVAGSLCSVSEGVTGGLVGVLDGGRIENCFNAAEITVQNHGGGLAGCAENGAALSRSYGIGFVCGSCGADFDALLALSDGTAAVENCYNIDSSGMYFGSHLTREEASFAGSFADFDFETIWLPGSGESYPYPVLRVCPFFPEQSFAPAESFPVSGVAELPGIIAPSSALAHEGAFPLDAAPSYYLTPNLPPIRDQGEYNICWAFADCAAAEISLIRKGLASPAAIDLAELQLARMHHCGPEKSDGSFNDPLDNFGGDRRVAAILDGDNDLLSSKTIASWMGLMQEDALTAYNAANAAAIRKSALPYEYAFAKDCAHLQNEREFPLTNAEDIKNAILEYGGVTMAYNHQSAYFTKNQSYYYCSQGDGTNHAVIIVGWDDNVSRSLFYDSRSGKRPARDGAWIIRNSHGAKANDNGLIYMSYDSSVFLSPACTGFAWDFDRADKYDFCYQYDGGVGFEHLLLSASSVYEANVFQASDSSERLEAVSFWLDTMSDVSYTVKIYTDLRSASNPASGTLAAAVPGMTTYAGYYTVPLPEAVELTPGSRFAVVIRLSGQSTYALPIDKTWVIDWFSSFAYSDAGESFYGLDGMHWNDLGKNDGGNLRIKAFSSGIKPDLADSSLTLSPSIFTYDGNEKKPAVTVRYNGVELRENTDYTLSYFNNINAGTARVSVRGIGAYSGSAETGFTILKARQLINAKIQPKEILVGGTARLSVSGAKGPVRLSCPEDSVVSLEASGVLTGQKPGSAVISVTAEATENYSEASASVSISVVERLRGDVDGSGTVDEEDLAVLMKLLAGQRLTIDSVRADLNGSGTLNAADLLVLRKLLAAET